MTRRPETGPSPWEELEPRDIGAWLGGLFEAGGSIILVNEAKLQSGHFYNYSAPQIAIEDDNEIRMVRLQRILGGKVTRRNEERYRWIQTGQRAINIGLAMEGFAPSRQEILAAFNNWEQAESVEEKVAIAQSCKGKSHNPVTVDDYMGLVKIPAFAAGVIDARGDMTFLELLPKNDPAPSFGWVYPMLQVSTRNTPLLTALKHEYGGYFTQRGVKGKEIIINKILYALKKDLFTWTVAKRDDLANIVRIVTPHLKLREI